MSEKLQGGSMKLPARPLESVILMNLLAGSVVGQAQSPVKASAVIETDYAWGPASGEEGATGLGFINEAGRLRLTEATVTLSGDWERAGFRIDGGYGGFYNMAMAADSWKGPNQYISQAYVFGKPFARVPIRLEAGKFFSSVGAEVPQSYLNFNTTRSLLFWYGSPLYHVGIRASTPITDRLTVGVQLLSGCNTVTGAHGHQSLAVTAARNAKRWGLSQLYMGGNDKPVGRGWRQLSDTVLTLHATPAFTAYAELLAATEKRAQTAGFDRWYGWAVAGNFSPRKKWSLSPRLEWFRDPSGATTGLAQRLGEVTFTTEYRPVRFAITRLEYRRDWSNQPVYPGANNGLESKRRQVLVGGITLLLSRGL